MKADVRPALVDPEHARAPRQRHLELRGNKYTILRDSELSVCLYYVITLCPHLALVRAGSAADKLS